MAVTVLNQGSHSEELSKRLNLPLVQEIPESYYLVYEDKQLFVKKADMGPLFRLSPQLQEELEKLKAQNLSVSKDLLCRALGYSGQENYKVLDTTVGFAKDALHLVARGVQVTGFERNPIVYELLQNSLEISNISKQQLSIHFGNSENLINQHSEVFESAYIDPMFEDLKKKSAPKKNLAFLRAAVDSSTDVRRVIECCWQAEIKRVVVKRPLNSENLYGKPNIVYRGKMIRYDVYTI